MISTNIKTIEIKKEIASIRWSEWQFVISIIIAVLLVTSIPYFYAYWSTPLDKQFMGIMVNVPDHVQYFSWMRELTQAHLSANKLTPEVNEPVFFNLLWWAMGRLSQPLGLGYAGMFQLLRLVATTLFLLLTYRICSWFFEDQLKRRMAFLLVTFASGFGWILVGLKYALGLADPPLPLLVFISEPNTFFNILAFPHFIAAALYIFIFDLVLRGQAKEQYRYPVAAGFVALFLGWQHAYDLVLVYGILGCYLLLSLLRDRRIPFYLLTSSLIIGFISCWPALYSVLLTSLDPLWKEVLAQFDNAGVFTPNPLLLPILLGPTFLLALFTLLKRNLFRLWGLDDKALFLKSWFLANFLLIYIPTDYQIHMLNGWQVPMAILATQGLFNYVIPFVQQRATQWSGGAIQRFVVVAFVAIILPTNLYIFVWRFIDLGRHDYPFYLHQEELAAMAWLEANGTTDDVVLSSLTIGQYIPALTGKYAFLAHWAQTVDFYGKTDMVNTFFDGQTDQAWRQEKLKQYSVDYLFYGPAEQELGHYQPESAPFLRQVYASPRVKIYQVQHQ
jgi:hypothetical protein